MTLELRPYQKQTVAAVEGAWRAGVRRPAVVLPTGTGKTVAFASLAERIEGRTLVVAHREELITQAAGKIRSLAPGKRVGIVKANRDNTEADVVVASVQTLASERRRARITGVSRVVIDECHHATADSYVNVLRHFGCFDEDEGGAYAVGFTATMSRGDSAALGDIWQDVVYSRSISEMINEGWLAPVRGKRVMVPDLNLRGVRKQRGDYSEAALAKAIEGSLAPELVAKAYAEHAPDDQGILFAPTVMTAELYANALRDQGISSALVHGAMPAAERAAALDRFREGRVQVLCNCMVLTEGTDLPMARVCVVGRPTLNAGLFVQMVGRVLRLWPGKADALVLDVSGASERHSLLASVELFGDTVQIEREEREEREEDESVELDDWTQADADLGGADDPIWLTGQTHAVEVDLFHGSTSTWLRTYAGIWVLPAGERYIVIQPSRTPGQWDVLWLIKNYMQRGQSDWVARDVTSLGYAMAFAEDNMTSEERRHAKREAQWRKRPASDKQRAYAERWRVLVPDRATQGEANMLIEQAMASARIDPFIPDYVLAQWGK